MCYRYDKYEQDFWIGYHENYLKEWVWKGGKENNFTKFAEGYPEFYKCARTSVKGFWKDRNCDELLPYICKKSASKIYDTSRATHHMIRHMICHVIRHMICHML